MNNVFDEDRQQALRELELALAYEFKDKALMERAFTHRSLSVNTAIQSYERLEFVGDAVFALVVAELLHAREPDAREGDLTKLRAALVREVSLAEMAKDLKLGKLIRMSKSERDALLFERPSVLADVMEALVGAVFLDGGFETSRSVVKVIVEKLIPKVNISDPKTDLQEILHARGSEAPLYRLESCEGPDQSPVFTSVVEVKNLVLGRGQGSTKKSSQQAAALQALVALQQPLVLITEPVFEHVVEEASMVISE